MSDPVEYPQGVEIPAGGAGWSPFTGTIRQVSVDDEATLRIMMAQQ